jgi:hypothetical protein
MAALHEFGAPLDTVAESDFAHPAIVFQIGCRRDASISSPS